MTEHVHLRGSKVVKGGVVQTNTIVRRRFAETEADVERSMGWTVDLDWSCRDSTCLLLPEPVGEWRGEGSG